MYVQLVMAAVQNYVYTPVMDTKIVSVHMGVSTALNVMV